MAPLGVLAQTARLDGHAPSQESCRSALGEAERMLLLQVVHLDFFAFEVLDGFRMF